MANNMASLLSQPSQATPPGAGPNQSQGGDQQSLQSLIQPSPQQPGEQPLPDAEHIKSALVHMTEFQRKWRQILETENVGKTDIKGPFIEAMAQLMGDQFITLPQALSLMKSFPEDPLQQRQFVEQHLQKDEQATMMLLQHVGSQPYRLGDTERAMQAKALPMTGHAERIIQFANHLKKRS
jgi:hypothetical protein